MPDLYLRKRDAIRSLDIHTKSRELFSRMDKKSIIFFSIFIVGCVLLKFFSNFFISFLGGLFSVVGFIVAVRTFGAMQAVQAYERGYVDGKAGREDEVLNLAEQDCVYSFANDHWKEIHIGESISQRDSLNCFKTCPNCKERNNPTFSVCWKCGSQLGSEANSSNRT